MADALHRVVAVHNGFTESVQSTTAFSATFIRSRQDARGRRLEPNTVRLQHRASCLSPLLVVRQGCVSPRSNSSSRGVILLCLYLAQDQHQSEFLY